MESRSAGSAPCVLTAAGGVLPTNATEGLYLGERGRAKAAQRLDRLDHWQQAR